MMRLAPLAVLLALCACARQEEPAPPAVTPPAADSASAPQAPLPPASTATPATAQNEVEQATQSQESGDGEVEHPASDASLEKIAGSDGGTPLPEGKWKAGVNYTVLVPAQPTNGAPGKVEVTEVFWLACPHCFAFEPFIQSWLKKKPAYVQFVRVPVVWQPIHRSHARLYYTFEALGRQDLIAKAFDTMVQQRNVLFADGDDEQTLKLQQKFATDNGVSAADFTKAYNSFTVNSNLQRADELTQRYRVQGVPFIIVNGKYTTDVAQAGGEGRLIELINDLSAAEHGH